MEDFLTSLYIENNYPAKAKLLQLAKAQRPEVKTKDVNDFLEAQMSYQLLKETKKLKSTTGHIVASRINEIWQMDIYDLSRYAKSNKGYNYMFAVVDVFTRYAYIIPMKNKDIDSTTKALQEILSYNKIIPVDERKASFSASIADDKKTKFFNSSPDLIMSDNDASFMGDKFQKLLAEYNIHHDANAIGDHNALGIIDNYAKRIKRILTAQFLQTKSKNWIDTIQKIVRTYNASGHKSLSGFSPMEVMTNDTEINNLIMILNLAKSQQNATTTDLKVGDSVRIRISDGFRKGTDPRYGGTVHKINVIYGRNIILDNGKKYIRANLLKVPEGSTSDEKPNIIQKAKTENKVSQMLKSNEHTEKPLPAQLRRRKLPRKAKE